MRWTSRTSRTGMGQYERLMRHWKTLYPDILDLDYDALVAEPRPAVERLLAYCGLDWEEAVLDFHKAGGAGADRQRLAGARAAVRQRSVGAVAELLRAASGARR